STKRWRATKPRSTTSDTASCSTPATSAPTSRAARPSATRSASSATTAPRTCCTRWTRAGFLTTEIRLQLPADEAVERIGPAPAQRDGEHDEAPHQRVLVARPGPAEFRQMVVDDDHHLDGDRRRPEAREEAERDAQAAQRLDRDQRDGERLGGLDAALHERHLRGR